MFGNRGCEAGTVERMQQDEMIERLHLVPLQVPDEMPVDRHIYGRHFPQRFLNLVLANVVKSAFIGGSHRVGTVGLRDRHDRDLLAVTSTLASRLDAMPHVGHALAEPGKAITRKSNDRESSV